MVLTVSAAMIVRDEEKFLGGCLETVAGRVDEIVIVDTGSSDRSRAIGEAFGARIIDAPWTGDFSAARNTALDAVSSDWVLYIDADERLGLPAGGRVRDYIDANAVAGFVRFRPKTGFTRYREWRLFRSDPRIRFRGRIHETMVDDILALSALEDAPVTHTAIEIDHLGYDGDQSHKHLRNLPLLREAVRVDPRRIFLWLHLTETLAALGETEAARLAAQKGLANAGQRPTGKDRAAASMIRQFLARDGLASGHDVLDLVNDGLAAFPDDLGLAYLKGRALLARADAAGALEIAQALLATDPEHLSNAMLAYDSTIFGESALELAALATLQLGRNSDSLVFFAAAAKVSAAA
jgi:hypothetical protein